MSNSKLSITKKIFNALNNMADRSKWFDSAVFFFGLHVPYILTVALFAFLLIDAHFYSPMVLRAIFASVLSRFIIAEVLYRMYPKKRPFMENEIKLLWVPRGMKSFPSGHATFMFAISYVVWAYYPEIGIYYIISSVLMAISRVVSGAHWPEDVLAGMIIGVLSGHVALMI